MGDLNKKEGDGDADRKPTRTQLEAENARLSTIVNLSSEEREHFDGLPEGMRNAFLGKSASERQAEIVAKSDADPVMYTTMDGIEIRKSAGDAFISIAKSNDELRKANAELTAAREQDALEKRAAELSHLPGSIQVRAALLKSAEGIADKELREGAIAALKSQNTSATSAFETYGVRGGDGVSESDDPIDVLAKQEQAADASLTYAQAYTKALQTREGQTIYAKTMQR